MTLYAHIEHCKVEQWQWWGETWLKIILGDPYFHEGVPIITVTMGIRDPQNNSIMGTRVPIIPGNWGPGVPVLGGPHFYLTPG